ncbi:unnamed protein product [Leptosia nina]
MGITSSNKRFDLDAYHEEMKECPRPGRTIYSLNARTQATYPAKTVVFKCGEHILTINSADVFAPHNLPPACFLSHSNSMSEREDAISLPLEATSAFTGTGSEAPTAVSPSLLCEN